MAITKNVQGAPPHIVVIPVVFVSNSMFLISVLWNVVWVNHNSPLYHWSIPSRHGRGSVLNNIGAIYAQDTREENHPM